MDEPRNDDQRYVPHGGLTRRALLSLPAAALAGCVAHTGAIPRASKALDDPTWRRRLVYANRDAEVMWSILGRKYGMRDTRLTPLWDTNTVAFSKIRYLEGGAYEVRTLEVVFYTELTSGKRLTSWLNPYSGVTRKVFLPDPTPVTMRCDAASHCERNVPKTLQITETESDPFLLGDSLWAHSEKRIVVRTNDTDPPVFTSTEFLSYQGNLRELERESIADATLNLEIISEWLPWMGMAGQSGGLYTRASGSKLQELDDLPRSTINLLQTHFPAIARNPFALNRS